MRAHVFGQGLSVSVYRTEYVERYVRFYLDESVQNQFQPFALGFKEVVSGPVLKVRDAVLFPHVPDRELER